MSNDETTTRLTFEHGAVRVESELRRRRRAVVLGHLSLGARARADQRADGHPQAEDPGETRRALEMQLPPTTEMSSSGGRRDGTRAHPLRANK